MIRNKAFWQRALVIFSVFSFCMSMLGSLPESLRYGYKLEAAADDVVRRLTVEQTLALYGRTLSGTWYNSQDGLTRSITFNYSFTSESLRPNDYTDTHTFLSSMSMVNSSSALGNQYKSKISQAPFLVYTCPINLTDNNSPWVSSSTVSHANVHLDFSINISHVSLWQQFFMWSHNYDNYGSYYYANVTTTMTGLTPYLQRPLRLQTSQNTMAYALFPWYKAVSQDSITESKIMSAAVIDSQIGLDGTYFDIESQDLNLQAVDYVEVDGSFVGAGSGNIGNFKYLMLFIGCPQISGINLFPETTPASTGVTAGTTVSYQTYPTVDLSGLESGVGTMVQMQDENNYYERIQIDQLNMIIAQLNAIYAAMVERGEVPVSLTDADSYPTLNNTVLSGVNDAITTYTMAQLPADQIGNGATGLTSFMFFLNSGPWMAIGLFFIGFAIFSWFIFRGRGI